MSITSTYSRCIIGSKYFDEINFDESVVMTSEKFDWKRVAKRLQDMARNPQKIFQISL